jgi:hypothetical protein
MPRYSFCESVFASGYSLWHIRELTDSGQFLGGGIDTPSLCGHVKADGGWDLAVDLTDFHLENNTCKQCLSIYMGAT